MTCTADHGPWRTATLTLLLVALGTFLTGIAKAETFARIELPSQHYENGRPILVHLPATYEEEARAYPVLYILNEEDNFHWAAQIVDFLSERNEIDKMIVVGLPEQGDYGRDNYPFASQDSSDPSPIAERYAAFLRTEVIPHVDANYRTEDSRFVAGHSMFGLFVTNLFRTAPDEFNLYIAVSPSLQYAPQLVDMIDERLTATTDHGALFYTIGDLEHVLIQDQFARMRDVLERHDDRDLHVETIPHNNHRSAAYSGLYNALSWAYRGWGTHESMPQDLGGAEGIVAHYRDLSDRLGYQLNPREGDLAGMAGFLLDRLDNPRAAAVGFQAELHFYPDSERAAEGYARAAAALSQR